MKILFCVLASSVSLPIGSAQESGSIEAYRARVGAINQAREAEMRARMRQQQHNRAIEGATQLRHPDFRGAAPRAEHATELLVFDKLNDDSKGFLESSLLEVFDVAGKDEVLLTANDSEVIVLLVGAKTDGLVNEQKVVIVGPAHVKGTKTYQTAIGGQNTVRIVRLMNAEQWKVIDDQRKADAEFVRLAADEALYHTWTSADGKHKTVAKFIKFQGGKVHLQNREGKVIKLSPNKLSREDQRYYRELVKEARKTDAERLLEQLVP